MSPGSFPLHHIGIRVESIEAYLRASLWSCVSEVVEDPLQEARLCLLRISDAAGPWLELVEPRKPVGASKHHADGWHHLCLSVPTQADGEQWARQANLLPVTGWKPAVLFDGRPVRFYYSRNRELLELLVEER